MFAIFQEKKKLPEDIFKYLPIHIENNGKFVSF